MCIAYSVQVRRNAHVEILPLSTGCLGACTYCKTRHARGALGSYALPALVERARQVVADPQVQTRATLAAGLGMYCWLGQACGAGFYALPALVEHAPRFWPTLRCEQGLF